RWRRAPPPALWGWRDAGPRRLRAPRARARPASLLPPGSFRYPAPGLLEGDERAGVGRQARAPRQGGCVVHATSGRLPRDAPALACEWRGQVAGEALGVVLPRIGGHRREHALGRCPPR